MNARDTLVLEAPLGSRPPQLMTIDDVFVKDAHEASLFATSFHCSYEAKVICDAQNNVLHVNKAFEEMTGYTIDEVRGNNPRILSSGQMSREFYQGMWQQLMREGSWQGELIERRKDGTNYPKFLTITVVWGPDGKPANFLGSFIDISSMKDARARLEQLANRDSLTNLYNRHAFDALLTKAVEQARADGTPLVLMYLDLDGFKKVNDSLGHAVGDELLRVVARRFQACVGPHDIVARLGGDEFAILMAASSAEDAHETARTTSRKLLDVAVQPIVVDGYDLHVSASIGIAMAQGQDATALTLMQHADTAMYEAKARGKNNFQFFTSDLYKRAANRLAVEGQMRRLLTGNPSDGFYVLYQPQFSLPERKIIGLEALLRLQAPGEAPVSPGVFIPIAEDTGLIHDIGSWVIEDVCRQVRVWLDQGHTVPSVSINVSSRQLKDPNFGEQLLASAARYNVPPGLLVMEITESIAMEQPERVIPLMHQLKEAGVGLAIDDFGTGYSNLSYLPKLPFDTLKIDRSFVMNIERDEGASSVAAATIALAHKLGYCVVAEGVETEAQAQFLQSQGCDSIQGFLTGYPCKADDISAAFSAGK